MKFKLLTLVDISETRARREQDPHGWRQQQNFNTVFGTISLRVNALYDDPPRVDIIDTRGLNFGSAYKGKQSVWEFNFYIEYEEGLSTDLLETDFDLIPFIGSLGETVDFKTHAFLTKDKKFRNIVFKCVD